MATIEESMRRELARAKKGARAEGGPFQASPDEPGCLRNLDADTRIVAANAGDHPLILELLVQATQQPLAEDFQSRLDEPNYVPTDRLLLRRTDQLLGQVQVSKLIGWFQGQRFPLARLQDVVTLPEYRESVLEAALLEVTESVTTQEGSVLGFLRSDRTAWLDRQGWSACRGQGHTRANTLAILAHLNAQPNAQRAKPRSSVEIRSWRHYELDSLVKVHQQLCSHQWGTLQRSLENWQWLVGRKAHDQVLIAVQRPTGGLAASPHEPTSPAGAVNPQHVVGYAVVRDSCLVEMLTLPGHESARVDLLARACRDAIDRDHHFVSLHTPATDALHELLVTAGGSWIADRAAPGGQWMLKLLAPERWVERLYPMLHQRAREAGIPCPLKIDFAVDQRTFRLTLTRRSARLETIGRPTAAIQRQAIPCRWNTLQNLLTSNLNLPQALAEGQLHLPDPSLLPTLTALFPPKLFWQSPWPQLRL